MRKWVGALAVVWAGAACGTEEPVSLGTGLVPINVNTFEVVLPSERFLSEARDFGGYIVPGLAGFGTIGTNIEGAGNVRTIVDFAPPPTFIEYRDSLGNYYYDEFNDFLGGRIVALIDTLRSPLDASFDIDVYMVDEEWHQSTANWNMRVDTLGGSVPWSVPGAGGGQLISQATWFPIEDSVVFSVDSQTVRILTDTLETDNHGVVFVARTPGSRIRFRQINLRIDAPGVYWPDSVYVISTGLSAATFIIESPTQQGQLKVGGVPTWRTFLKFKDGMDTVTVCGGTPQRCGTLAEADINYAALVVQPVPVPGGFIPEDTLDIEVREILHTGVFPIERSPVGNLVSPPSRAIEFHPGLFVQGAITTPVEVPITRYVAAYTRTPSPENPRPASYIALMSSPESATFGYGAFAPPDEGLMQLKLIVSFGSELDNP